MASNVRKYLRQSEKKSDFQLRLLWIALVLFRLQRHSALSSSPVSPFSSTRKSSKEVCPFGRLFQLSDGDPSLATLLIGDLDMFRMENTRSISVVWRWSSQVVNCCGPDGGCEGYYDFGTLQRD